MTDMRNIETTSPGSLNEFKEQHTELSSEDLLKFYNGALASYRRSLATMQGVHVEELHHRTTEIDQLTISEEVAS